MRGVGDVERTVRERSERCREDSERSGDVEWTVRERSERCRECSEREE